MFAVQDSGLIPLCFTLRATFGCLSRFARLPFIAGKLISWLLARDL